MEKDTRIRKATLLKQEVPILRAVPRVTKVEGPIRKNVALTVSRGATTPDRVPGIKKVESTVKRLEFPDKPEWQERRAEEGNLSFEDLLSKRESEYKSLHERYLSSLSRLNIEELGTIFREVNDLSLYDSTEFIKDHTNQDARELYELSSSSAREVFRA